MKKYAIITIIYAVFLAVAPLFVYMPNRGNSPPTQSTSSVSSQISSSTAVQTTNTNSNTLYDENTGNNFLVLDTSTNKVMELTEQEYLFGVLAGELLPNTHPEALKAQVVAAYSNACLSRNEQITNPSPDFKGAHLTDDPSKDQAYLTTDEVKAKWGDKYDEYAKKFNDCIAQVLGEVVSYKGEIALAPFFAISSGQTEYAKYVWSKDLPYLIPVQCPNDLLAPDYRSTVTLSKSEFVAKSNGLTKYVETGNTFAVSADAAASTFVAQPSVTKSGTVIGYPLGGATFTGQEMRTAFGLRSANFTVTSDDKENITFTVNGYGHDVGMSQNSANYMAEQGSSYVQILKYFYTGADVVRLVNTK